MLIDFEDFFFKGNSTRHLYDNLRIYNLMLGSHRNYKGATN